MSGRLRIPRITFDNSVVAHAADDSVVVALLKTIALRCCTVRRCRVGALSPLATATFLVRDNKSSSIKKSLDDHPDW